MRRKDLVIDQHAPLQKIIIMAKILKTKITPQVVLNPFLGLIPRVSALFSAQTL